MSYYDQRLSSQGRYMKRANPYLDYQYSRPATFIGPVRSQAIVNRQVALGRYTNRGFKQGYTKKYYPDQVPEEKKFLDTTLAFDIDATGETASSAATGQIALIPQGDTESTRDGRQCIIQSIQLKATLTYAPGASATATGTTVLYLIEDTQTNGAQASYSDIFTSTASNAFHNLSNSTRFRTLKKWRMVWNPPAGATTNYNTVSKHIDFYKKCSIPMEYSGATGAIGEIKSNNIFLAYAGGSNIDDLVSLSGISRIRFRG